MVGGCLAKNTSPRDAVASCAIPAAPTHQPHAVEKNASAYPFQFG
jgi:hypothetical protein